MRVLLDECVPRPLGRELAGHAVATLPQAGLAGVSNGALLGRIAGLCEAFVTVDKGLPNQQRLSGRSYGVIVLRAPSNRLNDLLPPVPDLLAALGSIQPGQVMHI